MEWKYYGWFAFIFALTLIVYFAVDKFALSKLNKQQGEKVYNWFLKFKNYLNPPKKDKEEKASDKQDPYTIKNINENKNVH